MDDKAKFVTGLKLEQISYYKSGIWSVDQLLIFWSANMQRLFAVPKGFVTDLCSVPRMVIIYAWVGNIAHAAGALHDFLYSLKSDYRITRAEADDLLYEAAVACEVPPYKAWAMWSMVRVFGWRFYKRK